MHEEFIETQGEVTLFMSADQTAVILVLEGIKSYHNYLCDPIVINTNMDTCTYVIYSIFCVHMIILIK